MTFAIAKGLLGKQKIYRVLLASHRTFFADALRTAFEPGSLANSSITMDIFSRVSRVSLSTSAGVRPLVGIGGRTSHDDQRHPVLTVLRRGGMLYL
jgi:hypothetical protein